MVDPKRRLAGCIYYVPDAALRLPGGEEREFHPTRPVLVVSDQGEKHGLNLASSTFPSVLIVPVSTSTSPEYRTKFDIQIPFPEGNLPRGGWARIPALQMIDKNMIGNMTGQVLQQTLDAVTSQILNYLGLV